MVGPEAILVGAAGRYQLSDQLGRGGFGVTYRARDLTTGHVVVVKVLRFDRMSEWKSHELFRREAAVLRRLSHPGIPAYIDDFVVGSPEAPEAFVLVQELVPGVNLAEVMRGRSGRALDDRALLVCFRQLLEVLDYLHRQVPPVIHRDVTPKNIVLRPDGRPALVDFGSVQATLRSESTLASTAAGTFGYAPMEQLVGRATPASDLHGLGMTMLAVATGLSPEAMPLDGARVNVRACLKSDRRLVALIESLTEPDPRRRLPDAATALQALAAVTGTAPGADRSDPALAGAAASVSGLDSYLALLTTRLRDEGFEVLAGGLLGGQRVRLLARRRPGPRQQAATHVYVVAAADLPGSSAPGQGLEALARDALAAHQPSPSLWQRLNAVETFVLPVLVTAGAEAPQEVERSGARAVGRTLVQPALVDLVEGATRLGPAAPGTRAGATLLPYWWWLIAPRLLERPEVKPRSLARLALATVAASLLVCAGLGIFLTSRPSDTYFLVYVAEPASGQIAMKAFFPGGSLVGGRLLTVDPARGLRARRDLPSEAYLCALSANHVTYFTRERTTGESQFWRASLDGGAPVPLFMLSRPKWRSCEMLGDRLALESTGEAESSVILTMTALDPPQPVTGSIPGDRHPAWYPDGAALAVATGPREHETLARIDLATGARTALTAPRGPGPHSDIRPSVSPVARRLAFYRSTRRMYGDTANRQTSAVYDLFLLDLPARTERLLIQDVCLAASPAWSSPDRVLYGKWSGKHCALYQHDLASGETTMLADDY